MITIALDFDGVIHRYSKGWQDGSCYDGPMEGAKEAIQKFQELGFAVCVYSTREPKQVLSWLWKHFPDLASSEALPGEKFWSLQDVIGVFKHKPVAMVYVDDRAVRWQHCWVSTLAHVLHYIRDEQAREEARK